MSETFFTADLHFGHKNIIRYDNRPFFTVGEMDNALIDNWNSVVRDKDDVYILGDVSWYSGHETASLLNVLKGRKHLILGNHDGVILKSSQAQHQFVEIVTRKEIDVETEFYGKIHVVMDHFYQPFFNRSHHGAVMLYGHTHNGDCYEEELKIQYMLDEDGFRSEAYNVGCMHWGYTPVTLENILFTGRGQVL